MNLRTLPKIELHLHLDCCLSYEAVRRLVPEVMSEAFASRHHNLKELGYGLSEQ
jgi:adenosine deaminase